VELPTPPSLPRRRGGGGGGGGGDYARGYQPTAPYTPLLTYMRNSLLLLLLLLYLHCI